MPKTNIPALIASARAISLEAGQLDAHAMPPVHISAANIVALREALTADPDAADAWEIEQHMRGDGVPLPAWDIVTGADGEIVVATVHTNRADAELICAAKAMRDALRLAQAAMGRSCHGGEQADAAFAAVNAALAEAEGRANG